MYDKFTIAIARLKKDDLEQSLFLLSQYDDLLAKRRISHCKTRNTCKDNCCCPEKSIEYEYNIKASEVVFTCN